MTLTLVPLSFKAACEVVNAIHRHHKAPQGHKFSIGLKDEAGVMVGVVIIGRPLSRYLDDGFTCEVTRLATDGSKNACSMLYGAAWRASKAMGYTKIITYILATEPGISLQAAGWVKEADLKAQDSWSKRKPSHKGYSEKRVTSSAQGVNKQRWVNVR